MTRYVAFLRAINISGRVVKMDELKRAFEALAFENVSTFIASGNVIFESDSSAHDLEPRIEAHLQQWFGYPVGTLLRTEREVARMAEHAPFAEPPRTYVLLMRSAPDDARRTRILELASSDEPVRVHEREVYWQPSSFLDSRVNGPLTKLVGIESTMRNVNTIRRLAAKLAAPAQPARPSRKTSGSVSKARP